MLTIRNFKMSTVQVSPAEMATIPAYHVVLVPDYEGNSPAGRAYPWDASGRKARAAMSAYGEKIPVPAIILAVPNGIWDKYRARLYTTSGRTNDPNKKPCLRYTAKERELGIITQMIGDGASIIWAGDAEELRTEVVNRLITAGLRTVEQEQEKALDMGRVLEYAMTGTFNGAHDARTDGVIDIEWGTRFRRVTVQFKACYCSWRTKETPNKTKPEYPYHRGTSAGQGTANYDPDPVVVTVE